MHGQLFHLSYTLCEVSRHLCEELLSHSPSCIQQPPLSVHANLVYYWRCNWIQQMAQLSCGDSGSLSWSSSIAPCAHSFFIVILYFFDKLIPVWTYTIYNIWNMTVWNSRRFFLHSAPVSIGYTCCFCLATGYTYGTVGVKVSHRHTKVETSRLCLKKHH